MLCLLRHLRHLRLLFLQCLVLLDKLARHNALDRGHLHQRLWLEVLRHDFARDPHHVIGNADHLVLALANPHGPILRLDVLRCGCLTGLRIAAHDVGDTADLVDVFDHLLADTDQHHDGIGYSLQRHPDDCILHALAECRNRWHRDHDGVVVVAGQSLLNRCANVFAASRVETFHADRFSQRRNPAREPVHLVHLVGVEQVFRDRDQALWLADRIRRLGAREEPFKVQPRLLHVQQFVRLRMQPDHDIPAFVPQFPDLSLLLDLVFAGRVVLSLDVVDTLPAVTEPLLALLHRQP